MNKSVAAHRVTGDSAVPPEASRSDPPGKLHRSARRSRQPCDHNVYTFQDRALLLSSIDPALIVT